MRKLLQIILVNRSEEKYPLGSKLSMCNVLLWSVCSACMLHNQGMSYFKRLSAYIHIRKLEETLKVALSVFSDLGTLLCRSMECNTGTEMTDVCISETSSPACMVFYIKLFRLNARVMLLQMNQLGTTLAGFKATMSSTVADRSEEDRDMVFTRPHLTL